MLHAKSSVVAIVLVAALGFTVVNVSSRVLATMGLERPYDVAFIPEGRALRLASPSIRLSIANYYWLATVQYTGEPRARQRGFERLYPLVDLVTDLDPGHGYAYQTAGIVLSAEGRLDESDRILMKGMEPGRPNWWSYPFYIAFNNYFYRGDYVEAARWAEIAARTPGASTNISHFAMALKVKSGDPDEAIRFLAELRDSANDEATAKALEEQYRLALLQRGFRFLDEAVAQFRSKFGRAPVIVEELLASGELAALPEEPFGGRYVIHPDGTVHSTANDHRFRPPEPPHQPAASSGAGAP
jgi:tetratricopeptide (TPR) repeat protein